MDCFRLSQRPVVGRETRMNSASLLIRYSRALRYKRQLARIWKRSVIAARRRVDLDSQMLNAYTYVVELQLSSASM